MEQLFVTPAGVLNERWKKAFPRALVVPNVSKIAEASNSARAVIWLDVSALASGDRLHDLKEAVTFGWPVVAMAATPAETAASGPSAPTRQELVADLALQDLAGCIPRQRLAHDLEYRRHLEAREMYREVVAQSDHVDLAAALRHHGTSDLFTEPLVGETEDGSLTHADFVPWYPTDDSSGDGKDEDDAQADPDRLDGLGLSSRWMKVPGPTGVGLPLRVMVPLPRITT